MCLVLNKKVTDMKKILMLLCFYSASLSTYAAGPNIQNIGIENPDDDILQVGVFEQTLSNITALTPRCCKRC